MIYLIGGTTGSGKSSFGKLVTAEYGIRHVRVDDVRMRAQGERPSSDPLRYFVDRPESEYLSDPVADLCLRQLVVATQTCVALQQEIEDARLSGQDVLFEGDDVLPGFAASWSASAASRAIFAVEDDPAMPFARERAPGGITAQQTDTFAEVHRCHGQRVAHEARLLGLEIVKPRTHDAWLTTLAIGGS